MADRQGLSVHPGLFLLSGRGVGVRLPPDARQLRLRHVVLLRSLHNTLGAFLAGAAIGNTRHFRHEMRESLDKFVTYMLAPIFFGSVCISADFIRDFDYSCVLLVFFGSCLGKLAGAMLGARLAGLSWKDSASVATCLNARGAMELILASVAMDANIINGKMFVALVFMAIVTSLLPGPLLRQIMGTKDPRTLSKCIPWGGFMKLQEAASLPELVQKLSAAVGQADMADVVCDLCTVVRHEAPFHRSTGSGIFRASLPNLTRPRVALAVLDGPPVMVAGLSTTALLLILTPEQSKDDELGKEAKMLLTSENFCLELPFVQSLTELLALIQIEHYRRGTHTSPGASSSDEMSLGAAQLPAQAIMHPEEATYSPELTWNLNRKKEDLIERALLRQGSVLEQATSSEASSDSSVQDTAPLQERQSCV